MLKIRSTISKERDLNLLFVGNKFVFEFIHKISRTKKGEEESSKMLREKERNMDSLINVRHRDIGSPPKD